MNSCIFIWHAKTFANLTKFLFSLYFNNFFFVFFQALEDDFAYQLEEQERHYGPYLNSALSAEAAAAEVRKYYYCYYH